MDPWLLALPTLVIVAAVVAVVRARRHRDRLRALLGARAMPAITSRGPGDAVMARGRRVLMACLDSVELRRTPALLLEVEAQGATGDHIDDAGAVIARFCPGARLVSVSLDDSARRLSIIVRIDALTSERLLSLADGAAALAEAWENPTRRASPAPPTLPVDGEGAPSGSPMAVRATSPGGESSR